MPVLPVCVTVSVGIVYVTLPNIIWWQAEALNVAAANLDKSSIGFEVDDANQKVKEELRGRKSS